MSFMNNIAPRTGTSPGSAGVVTAGQLAARLARMREWLKTVTLV